MTQDPRQYEKNWKSRRKEVTEIRNQLQHFMSQKEVGEHFGISQQAVDQIEIKALWKIKIRMLEACKELK
jgi:DNA-directed RNA polymerase specialized sigma subunit